MEYDHVKAILYSYPVLGALEEAVSVSVENQAALSFRSARPADEIAEQVASRIFTCRALHAIRILMDDIVASLSEEEQFLLEYKYFRRKKVLREKFSDMKLTCSERNYFRKQAALLKKTASALLLGGWTRERFERETGGLFEKLLTALESGREQALVRHRGQRGIQSSVCSSKTGGFLPRTTKTAIATAATQAMQITAIAAGDSAPPALPAASTDAR